MNLRRAMHLFYVVLRFFTRLFDIMVPLPIHRAEKAKLAGLVNYFWMYPIERYRCTLFKFQSFLLWITCKFFVWINESMWYTRSLMRLKSYVHYKRRPEGSITEGYLADWYLTFSSGYFQGVETCFSRLVRHEIIQWTLIFEIHGLFSHWMLVSSVVVW